MIVIHEYFIAKPGQASKLAALMKDVVAMTGSKARVMTDVTGSFNKVVIETEVESLADFERRMQEYGKIAGLGEKMKGYTEMYLTGGREVYRVA